MSFGGLGDMIANAADKVSSAAQGAYAAAAPKPDPVEKLTGWKKSGKAYVTKGGAKVPTWAVGLAVAFGGLYVLRKLT